MNNNFTNKLNIKNPYQQNFQTFQMPNPQPQYTPQPQKNQDLLVYQTPQKLQKKVIKKKSTKNQRFIYQCDMCPQTFTQLFNMHNHIKNIHELNPHVCPQCTPEGIQGIKNFTAFSHVKELKEHARKVHNGKLIRLKRDQKIYLSEEEYQQRMKCSEQMLAAQNNNSTTSFSSQSLNSKTTNYTQQYNRIQNNNNTNINSKKVPNSIKYNKKPIYDQQSNSLVVKEEFDDESSPLFSNLKKSSTTESSSIDSDFDRNNNNQYYKSEILVNQGWVYTPQMINGGQFGRGLNLQGNERCGYRSAFQIPPLPPMMPMVPMFVKQEN